MPLLGFSLASLIGFALGLLGGGGSILTVPVLVYVLGFPAKEGIAMSLAVVGVTSLFGVFGHWRQGNVQVRAAFSFGAMTMAGTYAGARLSAFMSGAAQLIVFSIVMLLAAVFMQRNGARAAVPRRAHFSITALSALGVGVLTGIAGVGGGFLIVPALVLGLGLPMKQAVGTSLLVIALNSLIGFAGYLGHVQVSWGFLSAFTAVAVAGIVAGTFASQYVPQATLKRAFSAFLVLMGVFILFKNRNVFAHPADTRAAPTIRGGVPEPLRHPSSFIVAGGNQTP